MQQPWPLGDNIGRGFPRLSQSAVEADGLSLKYLHPDKQADREIVLKAVWQNGRALQYAPEAFQNDREVVLRAVKQDGDALQWASPELRQDREVVLKAMARTADALRHVPEELWEDRGLMLEAIRLNNRCLFTMPWFLDDTSFVLEAMVLNGMALAHASKRLQGNRKVVLTAVTQNGLALQFASLELRADPEVVMPAVAQNGYAFGYATRELRSDPHVAFQAVSLSGRALQHMSQSLMSDANDLLLQFTKPHGPGTHAVPYLLPAGGPFDEDPHRDAVLKALARKWKVPGWRSGSCVTPKSGLSTSAISMNSSFGGTHGLSPAQEDKFNHLATCTAEGGALTAA